jgi:peptidoglycan/LPS O-acetylase OafA/YrhL
MAALARKLRPEVWQLSILLGVLSCFAYFAIADLHRVFFGLALAPIVLGLALMEMRFAFRVPRPIMLLGAASYAIYLVHNPLQSLVARSLQSFDSWSLTFFVCVLAGVAVGTLYHLLYEMPVLNRLSRRSRQSKALQT